MQIHSTEFTASPFNWLLNQQRQRPENNFSPTCRVGEAAKLLGCSTGHIRRLIRAGILKATRYGVAGYWRVPESEILRLNALREKT